jgi:hypothetical protein
LVKTTNRDLSDVQADVITSLFVVLTKYWTAP